MNITSIHIDIDEYEGGRKENIPFTYLGVNFTLLYNSATAAVFMKFTRKILIGSFKPSNPFL